MDLRDLAYFETIAELGHLGQAAEVLHRTQPALSKCLQRLEEELQADLFARVGRRIELTPMGTLLLERARHVRRTMEETTRELNDFANGAIGHVRIGSAATTAEFLLPRVSEVLLKEAPAITMELQIGMNDVLHDQLRAGQLDLVIGPLVEEREGLIAYPIVDDAVVVVASRDHEIFRAESPTARLAQYRWILPARSVATRQWLDSAMTALGFPAPEVQIETNSISLLPPLIARTGLLSFIARRNLGEGKLGALLREVEEPALVMKRKFGVAYRAQGYLSPATVCMLNLLRTRGSDLMDN
jgi:DNA-binding transcriptional LysR family regulator